MACAIFIAFSRDFQARLWTAMPAARPHHAHPAFAVVQSVAVPKGGQPVARSATTMAIAANVEAATTSTPTRACRWAQTAAAVLKVAHARPVTAVAATVAASWDKLPVAPTATTKVTAQRATATTSWTRRCASQQQPPRRQPPQRPQRPQKPPPPPPQQQRPPPPLQC